MAKSKAKRSHSTSLAGELTVGIVEDGLVTVTETMDKKILTFDLIEALAAFDGKYVTITIKEDTTVEPTEVEGEEE